MKTSRELLKKLTITQRCAVIALFFLGSIFFYQLIEKQHLAEKFAILLYYSLVISTLFAITQERRIKMKEWYFLHMHAKIHHWYKKHIHKKLSYFNNQKQYRWTYVCYFVFVLAMIENYGFTDGAAFGTLIMGWLMIYFSGYYFLVISGVYILSFRYLGEASTNDLQYSLAYFVCGIITILISTKKSFK